MQDSNGDTYILTTAKSKDEHIHISDINYNLQLKDIYADRKVCRLSQPYHTIRSNFLPA